MRVRPARAAAAVVLTLVLLIPVTYAAQLSMQEIPPLPLDDTCSQLSDDARKGDSGFSRFYRYVFITDDDDDKESPTDKLIVSENIQDGNIEIIYMTVKS